MRFADNRNKIGKYIPAVVFLIFIYGMALWFIFSPKPDYSSSEKRYLQKFPEVTAEKLLSGDFGSEFETFFADRFPQRNTWVGLNAYTALAEGNNGASGVYNCKNGYLINKPVSTENNLDKNIGAVADFANQSTLRQRLCSFRQQDILLMMCFRHSTINTMMMRI